MDIFLKIAAIMLPILFGYFLKKLKVFSENEIPTLRKFVVRATVPFIIFKNLSSASFETLHQIISASSSFFLVTLIFSITAFWLSKKLSNNLMEQNAYIFSVFAGNYGFLGWGVMAYFYGDAGFTRAVFFSLFFWPVFLLYGFFMVYLQNKTKIESKKYLYGLFMKNASMPLLAASLGIFFDIFHLAFPPLLQDFISKFANITIPLILFTIGLSFKFRIDLSKIRLVIIASFHRIVLGFLFGLFASFIINKFFFTDLITQKVILLEATMPTAAMVPFFTEYTKIDKQLQAAIITFSTTFSLVTIPFWYFIVEHYLF